jgi:hypothetical protein
MLANNHLGTLIIQNESLGGMVQLGGSSKLGALGAPMKHEGSSPASHPSIGPQVSEDSSRTDLSSVIQRDFNGYRTEEVVKEHSVSDITPSRLEERMNMLHLL